MVLSEAISFTIPVFNFDKIHAVMNSEQILSLPIEKKIGQLFFIGLPGAEIDEASAKLLEEISPGGVCLFARNIREAAQTRGLLDNIREHASRSSLF